jgi:uncharacterized protein (TIGR02145 family)
MMHLKTLLVVTIVVQGFFYACTPIELGENEMRDNAGNVYKTVTVGRQIWMASNLKALYVGYKNETGASYDAFEADYYYPGGHPNLDLDVYGLLYSYEGARELLPGNGWRIPTKYDIAQLLDALGVDEYNGGNAIKTALNITKYPGYSTSESFGISFEMWVTNPDSQFNKALVVYARNFLDDDIYANEIYWDNYVSAYNYRTVRFVKDRY